MPPIVLALIQIVVLLLILGLMLWAVQSLPIDPTIARIIRVVVIVAAALAALLWLLRAFGVPWPAWGAG